MGPLGRKKKYRKEGDEVDIKNKPVRHEKTAYSWLLRHNFSFVAYMGEYEIFFPADADGFNAALEWIQIVDGSSKKSIIDYINEHTVNGDIVLGANKK